jgi:hypothetical protein
MNSRAKGYLDKILEEEIKKEFSMRSWVSGGTGILNYDKIREEVEKRLSDANNMTEFNKY